MIDHPNYVTWIRTDGKEVPLNRGAETVQIAKDRGWYPKETEFQDLFNAHPPENEG